MPVALRDAVSGYAGGMAQAISVLATVEGRSQLDVFNDLQGAGADVIRMRSANGAGKNMLSLQHSARLLNEAYGMMASAARSVEKPQAAYRGKISSDVTEFLDAVWPLPSYHEGCNPTLHSPVRAKIGDQTDMLGDCLEPFSRRVTRRCVGTRQQCRGNRGGRRCSGTFRASGAIRCKRQSVRFGGSVGQAGRGHRNRHVLGRCATRRLPVRRDGVRSIACVRNRSIPCQHPMSWSRQTTPH